MTLRNQQSEFSSNIMQQMHKRINRQLHVITGSALKRVVADPSVLSSNK